MSHFLQDKERKFYEAATRLEMKISFEAHDLYLVDIFYHNSCFVKFAIKKKVTVSKDKNMENLQNDILEEFPLGLKNRVIYHKEAFLLSDPLDNIKRLRTENGLEDALKTNTHKLKRKTA